MNLRGFPTGKPETSSLLTLSNQFFLLTPGHVLGSINVLDCSEECPLRIYLHTATYRRWSEIVHGVMIDRAQRSFDRFLI